MYRGSRGTSSMSEEGQSLQTDRRNPGPGTQRGDRMHQKGRNGRDQNLQGPVGGAKAALSYLLFPSSCAKLTSQRQASLAHETDPLALRMSSLSSRQGRAVSGNNPQLGTEPGKVRLRGAQTLHNWSHFLRGVALHASSHAWNPWTSCSLLHLQTLSILHKAWPLL